MVRAFLVLGLAILSAAASAQSRPFRLGFTPFPYDITLEAVDFSYAALAKDADLVVHHFDDGVPWAEALADAEYPPKVRDEWADRLRRTPKGHSVYLALTPLNLGRDGFSEDLSAKKDPAWSSIPFDDDRAKRAFLNHCRRAVKTFRPDFLAIGIETNLLRHKAPAKWSAYLALHRFVFDKLKQENLKLPIFATVVAPAILKGYATEYDNVQQVEATKQILDYSDLFALSLYPYMSAYMTERLPDDMFDQIARHARGKPMAIAESGYPAEEFSISEGKLVFRGTDAKQADWIRRLLSEAQKRRFRFVVNYVIRDYEPLWEKIGRTDLGAVWKDTGVYDEHGKPRPSLEVWREALRRRYAKP
jgi:hypothetical protein